MIEPFSRNLNLLTPSLIELEQALRYRATKAGINYLITCTARQARAQLVLYAQGRNPTAVVNNMRSKLGWVPITDKQNVCVTWTTNSLHVIDLEDSKTTNDLSKAFDLVILDGKKAIYDVKVDINKNRISDYLELANIGKSLGLIPGAFFKKPDFPHYQEDVNKKVKVIVEVPNTIKKPDTTTATTGIYTFKVPSYLNKV